MSLKLRGSVSRHVAGWLGGVLEGAEPDVAHPSPYGSLAGGLNVQTAPLGRIAVRGGSEVLLTFAAGAIDDVLGIWPFSPTGAIAIAYDSTADKHYAYALTDELGWALPVATPTETGSRVDLAWNTATAGAPTAVELFETLYVADASVSGRRAFSALSVVADALTLVTPTYNLGGTGPDPAYPYALAVYNSALFLAGWDSDAAPDTPHLIRNSLLGTNPANAAGFDPEAYAIIGAQGQRVTAMEPGRELLLVAKAGELYRIFGTGQALPGWFYAIQAVENTQGYGPTNPRALKFLNGFWYGISAVGPFRTDGSTVEPLGIPWRESWARVSTLDKAWVAHHPDPTRRKVWFGFPEGNDAVAASVIWPWDMDRETWSPPHRYAGRTFHLVNTILPGTTDAPSGAPSSAEQRFDNGDWGFASVAIRWTSGDVSASTEVWGRAVGAGGAYTLQTIVPAGIQRAVLAASGRLAVKLRHSKSGILSDFSGSVVVAPRVPAPTITLASGPGFAPSPVTASVYNPLAGATITVTPSSGAWTEVGEDLPVGTFLIEGIDNTACASSVEPDAGITLQAQGEHSDWPLGYQASRVVEMVTHQAGCTTSSNAYGPTVRQVLEGGGMQPTSIRVKYHPQAPNRTYRIEYRLASDTLWTTHSATLVPGGTPHETVTVEIGGLTPGRKYHVRCVMVEVLTSFPTQAVGTAVDCFTTLPVPVQTAVAIGSTGLPNTRLTLTAPYNGAGIVNYDAREDYLALYTNQPGTPVQYDTTVGSCGQANRFTARTYDADWPEGFRYSEAVTADVEDPCLP